MSKELICVYQDCAMCGDRGKKIKQFVETNGLNVRKVSFASEEGKELIYQAMTDHGIKKLPFFTDGKKFSENIADFVKKADKKVRAKQDGDDK